MRMTNLQQLLETDSAALRSTSIGYVVCNYRPLLLRRLFIAHLVAVATAAGRMSCIPRVWPGLLAL